MTNYEEQQAKKNDVKRVLKIVREELETGDFWDIYNAMKLAINKIEKYKILLEKIDMENQNE